MGAENKSMRSTLDGARPASVQAEHVRRARISAALLPRGILRTAIIASIAGLIAFLSVQTLLATYNVDVVREAVDRGLLHVSERDRLSIASRLAPVLIGGAISYVMLAFVGSAIASGGHRILFALPATTYVFSTVLVGPLFRPEAIGAEWSLDCYSDALRCAGPWFGHPWIGPLVDLALVLVPGWLVARSVRPRRWPGRTDAATIAAVSATAAIVTTAGWAITVIERHTELRTLVALAALGLALGVTRPWWPWLHVLFAAFVAGVFGWVVFWVAWPNQLPPALGYTILDELPYMLAGTWPLVMIGIVASAWQPLAWTIRRLLERPIRLAIAVIVLNIVDAVLTFLAVRSGGAIESNPIVRFAGLPAKIALVGLLTWLLYRRKPTALVWPFTALLWVAGYHVAGIFVNGWR
jgi:hypothetical protein